MDVWNRIAVRYCHVVQSTGPDGGWQTWRSKGEQVDNLPWMQRPVVWSSRWDQRMSTLRSQVLRKSVPSRVVEMSAMTNTKLKFWCRLKLSDRRHWLYVENGHPVDGLEPGLRLWQSARDSGITLSSAPLSTMKQWQLTLSHTKNMPLHAFGPAELVAITHWLWHFPISCMGSGSGRHICQSWYGTNKAQDHL